MKIAQTTFLFISFNVASSMHLIICIIYKYFILCNHIFDFIFLYLVLFHSIHPIMIILLYVSHHMHLVICILSYASCYMHLIICISWYASYYMHLIISPLCQNIHGQPWPCPEAPPYALVWCSWQGWNTLLIWAIKTHAIPSSDEKSNILFHLTWSNWLELIFQ